MFRNIIIGGVSAVALSAIALTPALANYAGCTENPEGAGCPGAAAAPSSGTQSLNRQAAPKPERHSHLHRAPAPASAEKKG
jgi:hypothetical protein